MARVQEGRELDTIYWQEETQIWVAYMAGVKQLNEAHSLALRHARTLYEAAEHQLLLGYEARKKG